MSQDSSLVFKRCEPVTKPAGVAIERYERNDDII